MPRCIICKKVFTQDREFEQHECPRLIRIPQTDDRQIIAPQDYWRFSLACTIILWVVVFRSLSHSCPGPMLQQVIQQGLMLILSALGVVFSLKGLIARTTNRQKIICLLCILPGAVVFTLFLLACLARMGILCMFN